MYTLLQVSTCSSYDNNNNNNNANICIARLKQNSSDALMAQTNTVSVFDQMTTVTASGVANQVSKSGKHTGEDRVRGFR